MNHLYVCSICQVEIEALAKRRRIEIDTFIKVGMGGTWGRAEGRAGQCRPGKCLFSRMCSAAQPGVWPGGSPGQRGSWAWQCCADRKCETILVLCLLCEQNRGEEGIPWGSSGELALQLMEGPPKISGVAKSFLFLCCCCPS